MTKECNFCNQESVHTFESHYDTGERIKLKRLYFCGYHEVVLHAILSIKGLWDEYEEERI